MKVLFLKKKFVFCVIALVLTATLSFLTFFVNNKVAYANEAIYKGNSKDSVALMFNVYGGEEYIDEILDILKTNNAKATFFIGGVWAFKHSEDLQKIASSGNEIGNHGYFHKDHKKLNEKQNIDEISKTHALVKEKCNIEMNLFAPPSGSFNKTTIDCAQKLGYKTIMWTADTIDWRDSDIGLITSRAIKSLKAGNLILMHPTYHTTKALDSIIKSIAKQGLKCDIVSNII